MCFMVFRANIFIAGKVNQFGERDSSRAHTSPERGCVEDQLQQRGKQSVVQEFGDCRRFGHCCDWLSAQSRSVTVSALHTYLETARCSTATVSDRAPDPP